MNLKAVHYIASLLISQLFVGCDGKLGLFFPSSSVLQITSALSVPVVIPQRKIFWDWGIQMNYDMPFKPSSFYAAAIWPDQFERHRQQRELRNETEKYLPAGLSGQMHPNDLTAGELYESIENMLTRYGINESCLLRSVCELARHPFPEEGQQNMLTALLTFTLTPSLHEAFAPGETIYREIYEEAERQGFMGENCAQLYQDCPVDILGGISKIIG